MIEKFLGEHSQKWLWQWQTLKLTVSEEWTDRITDFLNVDTWSQKLKADQKMFAHGTLKLTVSQKWTDEIK